jgi:hypothetical protein
MGKMKKLDEEATKGREALDEIKQYLEDSFAPYKPFKIEIRVAPKEKTCDDAIKLLCKEGWFNFPRTASEVHRELSKRGYGYGKSRISHSLLSLVKEGYLLRTGFPKKYRYFCVKKP